MSCFACAAWIAMNCPSCFEVGWTAFLFVSLYFLCIFFALYWFPLFAQSHAQVWFCQDTDGACTFCACLIWFVLPLFRCREWHFGQELVLWFMSCSACAAWIATNWYELSILFWGRLSWLLCFFVFSLHYYWLPLFAKSHAQVWFCQDTDSAYTFCACLIWLVLPL